MAVVDAQKVKLAGRKSQGLLGFTRPFVREREITKHDGFSDEDGRSADSAHRAGFHQICIHRANVAIYLCRWQRLSRNHRDVAGSDNGHVPVIAGKTGKEADYENLVPLPDSVLFDDLF